MYFTGESEPRGGPQRGKDIERRAAAARKAFPDWDFHEVFGGWEAVPKGTRVVRGMFLEIVVEKLREATRGEHPYPDQDDAS